ncbi:uncharacterized protein LOC111614160 [Centruroides sculpturatus]|uniref:uncharacterized protein LOC111614160 n=1 Tax=Centruroides sculpturatus TaxID=218467 RepID=UPI000C6ECFD4|nr:uncharacterized protein LOC111614160 [Centruroides sculpturatus]
MNDYSNFSTPNSSLFSDLSINPTISAFNKTSLVSNSISDPPPVSSACETPSIDTVVCLSAPAGSSDLPHGMADTEEINKEEAIIDRTEANHKISATDEVTEESLTDAALRELESRGKSGMPASKSTLIIHSVAREAIRPTVKVKLDKNGRWHEVSQQDSPGGQSGDSTPSSPQSKQEGSSTMASTSSSASERDDEIQYKQDFSTSIHRSRSKEKRSLMGTLRRRLSLRKTRSKSMEQKADKDETRHPSSRSVSADRSRSMPESRETSSLRSSGKYFILLTKFILLLIIIHEIFMMNCNIIIILNLFPTFENLKQIYPN